MDSINLPVNKPKPTNKSKAKLASEKKPMPKSEKGGLMTTIIAVIITATVVGGVIYFWTAGSVDEKVSKVETSARNTRKEFETRIDNLMNELNKVKSDKEEIEKTADELKAETSAKEDLLKGAKLQFENKDAGFAFEYPAIFGEFKLTFADTENGRKFKGIFANNEILVFGGASKDYINSPGDDMFSFQGYTERSGKYLIPSGSENFEFEPFKTLGEKDTKIVFIDELGVKDTNMDDGLEPQFSPRLGNVAALMNLSGDKFGGLYIQKIGTSTLPMLEFENILKTIRLIK